MKKKSRLKSVVFQRSLKSYSRAFFETFKKPFRSLIRGSLLILLQPADCNPVTLKGDSLKMQLADCKPVHFILDNTLQKHWKSMFL